EQVLIPFQLETGVQAALHQGLVAAQGDGFLDLLVNLLTGEDVGVGVLALAVEGAEVADGGADVGVVDVAVDVVGAVRLGVEPAADGVGGPAEGVQVAAIEQGDAFLEGEALAVNCPGKNTRDGSSQGSLPGGPVPVRRRACSSG